jgi:hypothetical protein
MTTCKHASRRLLGAAALVAGIGCNQFVSVDNPNVIDVNAIDLVRDAGTLANSVQQNFAVALGWSIMYSSWFNGESIVAETFPTRNEFGRRAVTSCNGSLSTDVWQPLSLAAASAKIVLDLSLPTPRRLPRCESGLSGGPDVPKSESRCPRASLTQRLFPIAHVRAQLIGHAEHHADRLR